MSAENDDASLAGGVENDLPLESSADSTLPARQRQGIAPAYRGMDPLAGWYSLAKPLLERERQQKRGRRGRNRGSIEIVAAEALFVLMCVLVIAYQVAK